VPATTPEYSKNAGATAEITSPAPAIVAEQKPTPTIPFEAEPAKPEPIAEEPTPKRTVKAFPKPKSTKPKGGGAEVSLDLEAIEARIKAIEEGLKPKAAQLKEVVETKVEKLGDRSPTTRRNFMDIFNATVPDPAEVGMATE